MSVIFDTHLTTNYQRRWKPGIRELIQNAFDYLSDLVGDNCIVGGWSGQQHEQYVRAWLKHSGIGHELLSVECRNDCILISQVMRPRTALNVASLYMHSQKVDRSKGYIGGLGEGLKICALHLLMGGFRMRFLMYQSEWEFCLRPNPEEPGFLGSKELIVVMHQVPQRVDSTLYIEITGANCLQLFKPRNYIAFNAFPVLFSSPGCQFLDVPWDNDNERVVYVNGLFVKAAPKSSISFHVNMAVQLKDMAADRDNLRVDLENVMTPYIVDALRSSEQAQDVCYMYIEKSWVKKEFSGGLGNDLRNLNSHARMLIRQHLQRKFMHELKAFGGKYIDVWPIKEDAKDEVRRLYELLGYKAIEQTSADFYCRGVDFSEQLEHEVMKLPEHPIPPDAQNDYRVLVEWMNKVNNFIRSCQSGDTYMVKFVSFHSYFEPFVQGDMNDTQRIILHSDLLNERRCAEELHGMDRVGAWVSWIKGLIITSDKNVYGSKAKKRHKAALMHIDRQLSMFIMNRNYVWSDSFRMNVFGGVGSGFVDDGDTGSSEVGGSSAGGATATTTSATTTTTAGTYVSPPRTTSVTTTYPSCAQFPPLSSDYHPARQHNHMAEIQSHVRMAGQTEAPLHVHRAVNHLHNDDAGNYDDAAPELVRKVIGNFFVYTSPKDPVVPHDLPVRLEAVNKNLVLLYSIVFTNLQGSVYFAYFKSECLAFYDPRSNHIYLNLYHSESHENMRSLFLTLCHELGHLALKGQGGHNYEWMHAVANLQLDYTSAFMQLVANGYQNC